MYIYDESQFIEEPWENPENIRKLVFDVFLDDHKVICEASGDYAEEYYQQIINEYIQKYGKNKKQSASIILEKCAMQHLEDNEKQNKETWEVKVPTNNQMIHDLNRIAIKEQIQLDKLLQRICTIHAFILQKNKK